MIAWTTWIFRITLIFRQHSQVSSGTNEVHMLIDDVLHESHVTFKCQIFLRTEEVITSVIQK